MKNRKYMLSGFGFNKKAIMIVIMLFTVFNGSSQPVSLFSGHNYFTIDNSLVLGLSTWKSLCFLASDHFVGADDQLERSADRSQTESRNIRIEKERYIIIGMGGVILIIILLFIMMYRQRQLRYQQKVMFLEQRLLRSQMNPHFIFNSLMNIQSFMMSNDVEKANSYLTRFAKLVRAILENSRTEYVPLEIELKMIKNYLELQKLRHDDKFEYSIITNDDIIPEDILIPPMLTQPFIENAIEHGIMPKQDKGTVRIEVSQTQSDIIISIEDNGIGRKRSAEINQSSKSNHKSLSTKITEERIKVYNSRARNKIRLEIEDIIAPEDNSTNGTRVKLIIPAE